MATINGTPNSDTLNGTADADTINGFDGNDAIDGGGGDDVIDGGDGDDYIRVGVGQNVVKGGAGNDYVRMGYVSSGLPLSIFDGGAGTDSFNFGVAGSFLAFLTSAAASTEVRVGDNVLTGFEIFYGGFAGDIFGFTNYHMGVTAYGGDGNDSFYGTAFADIFYGEANDDSFTSVGAGDRVYGGPGDDDFFVSGAFGVPASNGVVDGGAGINDVVKLNIKFDVDLQAGTAVSGSASYAISGIETVLAAAKDGYLTTVRGTNGNEIFAINPLFDDGTVGVEFYGRGGNDELRGSRGDDVLDGGAGTDFLDGGAGNDRLFDDGGYVTLVGGAGADTLTSTAAEGGVFASHLYNGFDNLDTLADADTLIGGAGSELFWAGFNDSVDGGGGQNTLSLNFQGAATGVTIDFRPLTIGQTVANGTGTIRSITGLSTIIGSQGNDRITGFSDAAIFPFSGLTLDGRDGNDILIGGDGGDKLLGGSGGDTLRGGGGRDLIFAAGEDYDPAITDTFRDALYGEGGDDSLSAGRGDTVDGGEGIDSLFLNLANATATAGVTLNIADLATATGVTIFSGTIRNIEILTGLILPNAGNMVNLAGQAGESSLPIFGGTARDVLTGSDFRDQFYGGDGDDELRSGAGNDYVEGGAGNDLVAGGAGRDSLFGGTGIDTVSYDDAASAVTISLLSNYGTDFANNVDVLNAIENAIGSRFADVITGDNAINDVHGGDGDDIIDGRGGSDNIFGDAGNDTLTGGLGSDFINGGIGADRMYGGQNNDHYRVDDSADLIFENSDDGVDSVVASASHYLFANVEHLELAAGAGDLFGVGNGLANMITGNEGANLLLGGGGEDVLRGGGGVDSLFGESGADHLFGDAGVDYLVGGIGNDSLDGGADADALYGEDGDDTLTGGASFDTDILVGGAGNDLLYGNSGLGDYDLLDGGAGNDIYHIDTPDDLTFEAVGGGTDTVYANINGAGYYLYANVENLVLEGNTPFGVGNDLANRLTGSATGNYLLGGAGNDILNGKAGNDVLFGESGADTFIFERGTGADVIGDFARGIDKIDVSAFGFASFAALQATFLQAGGDGAIQLGSGDLIVLHGVDMAALASADFILSASSPKLDPFEAAGKVDALFVGDADMYHMPIRFGAQVNGAWIDQGFWA